MPTCPAPERECESKGIDIDACGHFFTNLFGAASMEPWMPNNPVFMTCEQKCVRYRQAVARVINTLSASDGAGYTYEVNIDHSYTVTRAFSGSYDDSENPRICEVTTVASGTGSSTEEFPYVADDVLIKQEIEYTLNGDGTASGTVTDTYPDPAYNETYPFGPTPFSETYEPTTAWDNGTLTATSSGSDPYDGGAGREGSTDWTLEVTYSNPITQADMEAEATLALTAMEWTGASCIASRQIARGFCTSEDSNPSDSTVPVPEEIAACVQGIVETRIRYKWCVPPEHLGSYYRIEWDEVFFPEGWDDSTLVDPPDPVVTPKSWEWIGPAGGVDNSDSNPSNDSADRCSPWSLEVKVPADSEGTVEIRNVRVLCYRSSYGQKFQLYPSFGVYVEPAASSV